MEYITPAERKCLGCVWMWMFMGVFVSLYDVCTSIYTEMKKYTRARVYIAKGAQLKYGAINKIKSFRKVPACWA